MPMKAKFPPAAPPIAIDAVFANMLEVKAREVFGPTFTITSRYF